MMKTDKKLSFEEALQKLEEAVAKLKSGECSLEESIKVYEESVKYYEICSDILENAKQKIEIYDPSSGKLEDFENE